MSSWRLPAPAAIVRGDARRIGLADGSVDLVIMSPPYYVLRWYLAGAGQIGAEPTAQLYLEALWEVLVECWRVLKPGGSCWVNLGDKRSGSSAPGTTSGLAGRRAGGDKIPVQAPLGDDDPMRIGRTTLEGTHQRLRQPPAYRPVQGARAQMGGSYKGVGFGRDKSKMLLPHRFAVGCEDGLADPCVKDHEHVGRHPAYTELEQCRGLGWIVRQDQVWWKPNGMPESATDRTGDKHEGWFHLTKQGDYFANMEALRRACNDPQDVPVDDRLTSGDTDFVPGSVPADVPSDVPSTGGMPPSVWRIATEPLRVPDYFVEDEHGWQMFGGVTTGEAGRRKVRQALWNYVTDAYTAGRSVRVGEVDHYAAFPTEWPRRIILGWSPTGICTVCGEPRRPVVAKGEFEPTGLLAQQRGGRSWKPGDADKSSLGTRRTSTQTGERCGCAEPTAPTRPAVVLDPFGGTGTSAMVARALGRTGISLDLSSDYGKLAHWRIFDSGGAAKIIDRSNRDAQGALNL